MCGKQQFKKLSKKDSFTYHGVQVSYPQDARSTTRLASHYSRQNGNSSRRHRQSTARYGKDHRYLKLQVRFCTEHVEVIQVARSSGSMESDSTEPKPSVSSS